MPSVQEVSTGIQEERHNLWLSAAVFEPPYTSTFTRFFPFDRILTHFIYIPRNYSYYRHVTY